MLEKPRKRIWLDLRPLQNGYAGRGIGRHTREMLRALLKVQRQKAELQRFELAAVAFENSAAPTDSENLRQVVQGLSLALTVPRWKRVWLWDQCVLGMNLAVGKPFNSGCDLFHSFVALGPLADSSIPLLGAGKCVATIHDWHLFESGAEPVLQAYRLTWRIRLQTWAFSHLAAAIAVSDLTKEQTAQQTFTGPDKIEVIQAGCDHLDTVVVLEEVGNLSWVADRLPGFNPSLPYVLSIGDTAGKNLGFAAEVISRVLAVNPQLQWVILGDAEKVAQQIGKLALLPGVGAIRPAPSFTKGDAVKSPAVKSSGFIDDAHLKALYLKATALLFPSTREGFGIPIIEAMRLGCPVVASRIEPFISTMGEGGILHSLSNPQDFAQDIVSLLQHSDARTKRIAGGQKQAEKLTWERSAQKLWSLWQSVLE